MTIDYGAELTIRTSRTHHGWRAETTIDNTALATIRPTEPEARTRLIQIYEDALFGFPRDLARRWRIRNWQGEHVRTVGDG
jgi:hypothetical protein